MPVRIQRRRTRGWRMPPNTVSVTRPGRHGNPFKIGGWYKKGDPIARGPFRMTYMRSLIGEQPGFIQIKTAAEAIEWYRWYRSLCPLRQPEIDELRGKDLACFCPLDQPCHADVLLELANK